MRQVLITGATGFVGSALLKRLEQDPKVERIHVLARRLPESLANSPKIRAFQGSITDSKNVEAACEGVDYVFHLACQVLGNDADAFQQTNVEGTRTLLAHLPKGCGLSYLSSAGVYGYGGHTLTDETSAPAPDTALALSRMAAENLILQYCKDRQQGAFILRPRFVYGPGDAFFVPLLMKFLARSPIEISKGQTLLSVIHVEDLVDAMIKTSRHQVFAEPILLNLNDFKPIRIAEIERILIHNGLIIHKRKMSIPFGIASPLCTAIDCLLPIFGKKPSTPISVRIKFLGENQSFTSIHRSTLLSDCAFRAFNDGMKDSLDYYKKFQTKSNSINGR